MAKTNAPVHPDEGDLKQNLSFQGWALLEEVNGGG